MDYISFCGKKGFAGSYTKSVLNALKSWLSYNDIVIKKKIKIKGIQDTPTLKDERIPTREELKKIFLSADKLQFLLFPCLSEK